MQKLQLKKALILTPILALITTTTGSPIINAASAPNSDNSVSDQTSKSFKPSKESIEFTKKLVKSGAIKEYQYSKDYKVMTFKHSFNEIKDIYNFTDRDIDMLKKIQTFYNDSMKKAKTTNAATVQSPSRNFSNTGNAPAYLGVNYGWTWIKLSFTNDEVKLILAEAAIAGPAALYGVLVSLSAVTATPVGGAIVAALGLLGLPKLAAVCQTIVRALAAGKGVFIEIGMDGIIPYITSSVSRH